jgi:hypothetical protein
VPVTREKIKPVCGAPLLLTLEQPSGTEVDSQVNGKEWRYLVQHDGRPCIMYLPRPGHDAIQRIAPGAGDVIELMRFKRGNTEGYVANYPDGDRNAPPSSNGHNGNGYHQNGHSAAPPAAAAPQRGSSHLARALCLAIDAAVEASEYARSKNFSVTFLGSDIRAMANTVMIGDQKRGDQ